MNVNVSPYSAIDAARGAPAAKPPSSLASQDDARLRRVFNSFVGQVFFGQLLKAMRKTVGKPAYLHGGRAEEIFQQQLDQILGEKLAETSGEKFSEPMFDLFKLSRR
jgi:Rod binding domain-containing protein